MNDENTNGKVKDQPLLGDDKESYGPANLPTLTSLVPITSEDGGDPITWAKDIPPPQEGESIPSHWGPFIFPGSIQIVAGEAGIGKTTLLYNIVVSLARGETYAGITPKSAIKVLYYDLETPELLRKHKLHTITNGKPPDRLAFATSFSINGARKNVQKHGFQLVVIDTINEAFNTREEEDNAEANRQMQLMRKLINETGVSIILVGHMGKDPAKSGVYKLRGASARPGAADVVMNLETEREDVIRLQIEKNRWLGGKDKIFFKKVGEDQFEPIEIHGEETLATEHKIEEFIASIVPVEPKTIETHVVLSKAETADLKRGTVEKVLSKMTRRENVYGIRRVKQGHYTRTANFRPNGHMVKSEPEEIIEIGYPPPNPNGEKAGA